MSTPDTPTIPREPGPMSPHRIDLVALVSGLGFLAVGLISLGHQLEWFDGGDRNLGGVTIAVIGAIGMLAVLAAGFRRSRSTDPDEPIQSSTTTPEREIDS